MNMKMFKLLALSLIPAAFLCGCYTQFVMVDRSQPPKEEVSWEIDSVTGDTVKVVRQKDTVHTYEHRTCIWERDLMGYPYLRCYDSFYPRDWYYYNYTPWWYYDYPYYYRGYYYHGGRRYYHHRDRKETSDRDTPPAGPSGSSYRSKVRGIPDPKAESATTGSGNSAPPAPGQKSAETYNSEPVRGEIIIPAESGKKPVIIEERGRGGPEAGTAVQAPVQKSDAPIPLQSGTAEAHPSVNPPATPPPASGSQAGSVNTPSGKSSHQPSQQSSEEHRGPHMRKARRW